MLKYYHSLEFKLGLHMPKMKYHDYEPFQNSDSLSTILLTLFFVSITSGLVGMFLALFLHYIQHLAYGYSLNSIISPESFLQGVIHASITRKLFILFLCGLIAGFGWWLLYRFAQPICSVPKALEKKTPDMPFTTTIINGLLQIITIALGSPLGRESAPREISSLFAGRFASKMKLSLDDIRIMMACASGAGLAAVYNVPLGGAFFTLEVLLKNFHWKIVLCALTSSTIAALISWIGLGHQPQYHLSPYFIDLHTIIIWSFIVGPFIGLMAYCFITIANKLAKTSPKNWRLPVLCIINFYNWLSGYTLSCSFRKWEKPSPAGIRQLDEFSSYRNFTHSENTFCMV